MPTCIELTAHDLECALVDRVCEVRDEPEFTWGDGERCHMTEPDGTPVVRVGVANCDLDTDLWRGVRNPSQVGRFPLGLEDIWSHYAANNIRSTRPDGSPNPLAMPETFEEAKQRFRRAVLISAMLPVARDVFAAYGERIQRGDLEPLESYCRARNETGAIIYRALGKLSLSLLAPDRAVVLMTPDRAKVVGDRTRAEYQRGKYHGPAVELFPQNSVALLTGLLQFGVSRIPFRDEPDGRGGVRRLMGQYGTIVVFDRREPRHSPQEGITKITPEWQDHLLALSDFTNVEPEIVARRFCTYNDLTADGESVCGKCLQFCPSGALRNSSPDPRGHYSEAILRQRHRFANGRLKFDAANCCRDRGQKGQLYAEYVCARCEASCAALGVVRPAERLPLLATNGKPQSHRSQEARL